MGHQTLQSTFFFSTVTVSNCSCTCNQYWSKGNDGRCTVCNTTAASSALCNGRGNVNPTICGGCTCNSPFTGSNCTSCLSYCVNGNPLAASNCQCSCNQYWARNTTTGACKPLLELHLSSFRYRLQHNTS